LRFGRGSAVISSGAAPRQGGITMGLRFSRRVTLFPGVRLNFSARGISATVGPRGASVNIGPNGSALNLGIPGTGLSFRQHISPGPNRTPDRAPQQTFPGMPPAVELAPQGKAIQSAPVAEVTSDGLQTLKGLIIKVRAEREELSRSIPGAQNELGRAERRLRHARGWFLGLFLKKKIPERQAAVEAKAAALKDLRERLEGSFIDAEFALDDATRASFDQLAEAFAAVAGCARIWDITSTMANDRYRTRSSAHTTVERRQVRFAVIEQDEVLQTAAKSLRLQNANGADLNIYPGFLLMARSADLALIDLREVTVEYSPFRFIEGEAVPSDAAVVDQTWAKCNKDGSPDRRFRDNHQIPVAQYATVHLGSPNGLNEEYMFSNVDKAQRFARALSDHQAALRVLGEKGPVAESPHAADGAPELPSATPPNHAPDTGPLPFKSLDLIKTRSAVAMDDATQTMIHFVELLQGDLKALNGEATKVEVWRRYVTACGRVAPAVREYFARSPAAKLVEPVAVREVNKLVRGVLAQLQSALESKGAEDADAAALLGPVRETAATLRE
jgi:hypothetical protein